MEPITNQNETSDLGSTPITPKKFSELVVSPENFAYRGSAFGPVAKSLQSQNYKAGVTGWKLSPNGTSEFN